MPAEPRGRRGILGWPETIGAVLAIRTFEPSDLPALVDIVKRLHEYFTDDVPEKVVTDLQCHQGTVILDGDGPLGFSVVDRRSTQVAEILWMAVDPLHRGSGVGSSLLNHVIDELGADGVNLVEVKTLDRSSDYQPYVGTRAFWERHGFVQIDAVDPLPGWQPGNPCALYVAALRTTR
jgi:GNAT superfamily N-acetyltransferase